jgi:hypothetical protein
VDAAQAWLLWGVKSESVVNITAVA